MINLIPVKAKQLLKLEYWMRVLAVWLVVWSVAVFAAASILLPAYVLIGSQVSIYEDSAAEVSENVSGYENPSLALVRASQQAKVVVDISAAPLLSDYVLLFEKLEGSGIELDSINVRRVEDVVAPVVLSGVASDRQALTSFRDRLLVEPLIKDVDLPISGLEKDKDLFFSITVTFINDNV
jgi:hypothetical protein